MPEAFALPEWHVLVRNLSLVLTASQHEGSSSQLKKKYQQKERTNKTYISTPFIDHSESPVMYLPVSCFASCSVLSVRPCLI